MSQPEPPPKPSKAATMLSIDGVFATLARTRDEQRALLGRHRRTVSIAKFVLPALAAVLLVALAVFPNLRSGANFGRISYKKQATAPHSALSRMSAARYRGVDAQGQKFTITARHALQVSSNRLSLTRPKGDITLNSGAWLLLDARTGLYHQKTQMLGLAGKVTLYRDDGTTLDTHRAAIDLKNGTASGGDPVFAYGPFGKLRAKDGFAVEDRGATILFKGMSHLTLDQVNAPPSGAGGAT